MSSPPPRSTTVLSRKTLFDEPTHFSVSDICHALKDSEPESERLPPLTPLRGGSVLSQQTFLAALNSKHPPQYGVSDIHDSLEDPQSGLDGLSNARVCKVTCYNRTGLIDHDYLILHILYRENDQDYQMHARCERRPNPADLGGNQVHTHSWDSISFSADLSRIHNLNKGEAIGQLQLEDVKMSDVTVLLHLISGGAEEYKAYSHNCWWFAIVVLTVLRDFNPQSRLMFCLERMYKRIFVWMVLGSLADIVQAAERIQREFHRIVWQRNPQMSHIEPERAEEHQVPFKSDILALECDLRQERSVSGTWTVTDRQHFLEVAQVVIEDHGKGKFLLTGIELLSKVERSLERACGGMKKGVSKLHDLVKSGHLKEALHSELKNVVDRHHHHQSLVHEITHSTLVRGIAHSVSSMFHH